MRLIIADTKLSVSILFIIHWCLQKGFDDLFILVNAIDCFVCNSINGSNSFCEDPFNTNVIKYLRKNCEGYKKDRQGNFPADHCIKIVGTAELMDLVHDRNTTIMVRTCALDSGTLTADTEIVRMSHCGHFFFGEIYYAGCVQSCEQNGCNTGSEIKFLIKTNNFLLTSIIFFIFHQFLRKIH